MCFCKFLWCFIDSLFGIWEFVWVCVCVSMCCSDNVVNLQWTSINWNFLCILSLIISPFILERAYYNIERTHYQWDGGNMCFLSLELCSFLFLRIWFLQLWSGFICGHWWSSYSSSLSLSSLCNILCLSFRCYLDKSFCALMVRNLLVLL